MHEDKWTRGQPELSKRVKELVALGYNRREITEKLKISRYRSLYGDGAFYDLNPWGRQGTMARDLRAGDQCVVATPDAHGKIVFSWFTFSHEALRPGEDGVDLSVLFGTWQRSETLPRDEAIRTEPYRIFFNINGHFKRPSVIRPNRGGVDAHDRSPRMSTSASPAGYASNVRRARRSERQ